MTCEAVAAISGSSLRVSYTRDGWPIPSLARACSIGRPRDPVSSRAPPPPMSVESSVVPFASKATYLRHGRRAFLAVHHPRWTCGFQDDSFTLGERARDLHEISLQNSAACLGTLR